MIGILAFLLKLGLGGVIERGIKLMERRAELEVDKEKLRTELTAEYLRQIVEETRVMADFNKAKLSFPWFWTFAALFLVPYGIWWNAVVLDSIGHFGWRVADLPTSDMKAAAAQMIQWLFYVGGGVAGAQILAGVLRR